MRKKKGNSLETELEGLALELIKAARENGTAASTKLDIFKAVSGFHVGITKATRKPGDDDDDDEAPPTFERMRKRINGAAKETD